MSHSRRLLDTMSRLGPPFMKDTLEAMLQPVAPECTLR